MDVISYAGELIEHRNSLHLTFKRPLVQQFLVCIITDQLIEHSHQWDKEYNTRQAEQFSPNEGSDQRPERRKSYGGTHYMGIDKLVFYKLYNKMRKNAEQHLGWRYQQF